MANRTVTVLNDVLQALLPVACSSCGDRGVAICTACLAVIPPAPAAPSPPGVDWWAARFAYEGVARDAIVRAKYRDERAGLRRLARELAHFAAARVVAAVAAGGASIEVVTWAPASVARRQRTGVDHGALLARVVSRAVGVPARALLTRTDGDAQTGARAARRRTGPGLRLRRDVVNGSVLVVDDVATTGGTLSAAARVLRHGGAHHVAALTLARTPRSSGSGRTRTYTSAPEIG